MASTMSSPTPMEEGQHCFSSSMQQPDECQTQTKIPFPGYQGIYESLSKTQRTVEKLVKRPALEEVHNNIPPIPTQNEDGTFQQAQHKSSPDDANRKKKCTHERCSFMSGSVNRLQLTWMKEILSKKKVFGSDLWFHPRLPSFNKNPDITEYFYRSFIIWHPHKQFGLGDPKCPTCEKDLKWKEYRYRTVEGFSDTHYAAIAIYKCATPTCNSSTFNSLTDAFLLKVPDSVMLSCPIYPFANSAVTIEVVELVFHSVSGGNGGLAKISSILANNRLGTYLRKACLWIDHVKEYTKKQLASVFSRPASSFQTTLNGQEGQTSQTSRSSELPGYPEFPEFMDHCTYNGSLGPSRQNLAEIFKHTVDEHNEFWKRYMGGITGFKIAADHHHNVSGRATIPGEGMSERTVPLHGVHAWMNERQQIGSFVGTRSTTTQERDAVAQEMKERFEERGEKLVIACLDKCCLDSSWILQHFPDATPILDNAHLISRYFKPLKNKPEMTGAIEKFKRDLSKAITGTSQRQKMLKGVEIFKKIEKVIDDLKTMEASQNVPLDKRIVTEELLKAHSDQRCHIEHCLDLPENCPWAIHDRFMRCMILRGTNQLENFWRHLRAVTPESCSLEYAFNLWLAFITSWNFMREIQFDKRWGYLPISPLHMALTQHIKLEHCEGLFAPPPDGAKGIAELFCVLPLARETSPHMFGIPPTFASTGVNLAGESIDPAFASAILSLSIGETTVFDHTIEKALQHWVPHSSDKQARTQPLEDTQSVSQEAASDTESVEGQFITPRIPPPRTSTSLMNPRRTAYSARAKRAGKGAEIRMGHSNTSKNRSNRRSKETGNPARMRKNWFGSTLNQIQTLAVHDETLEQVHIVPSQNTIIPLSSLQNSVGKTPSIFYQFQASLNPFERRFLRFIVLHYYPWRDYMPNDLRQIDTKNINYRLLHKMWNAFVNGFHRSDNPFKTFIKMHTQVQLKNALEAYVGLLKVTPCSGLPSRLRQGELSQSFNLAVQKIIEEGESSMQQNASVQGSNTTTEIFQEQTIVTTRTYMRQVSHSKEGEADGNRGITHERSANISTGSVNPNEDIHSATLDTNKAVPMISTSINQPESGDIGPQLDTPQQDDEHVQNVDESELNIIDNLQTTIDGEASDIQDDNPTSTREWVLKLNPELFDAVRQAPKSGTGRIKWPFVYAQWRRIGLPVHMNTSVYHSYNNSLKFKRKRDAQKNKNSLRNAVIRADSDSRIHENMSCSIHREETLRINNSTDLEEGLEPLVALSNIVPPAPDDEIDNSLISQNTNKKINAPVPPGKRRKLRKTASASSSSSEEEDSTQDQPPSQPQRNLHTEKPGYQNLSIPENAITSQILGQVQQQKSNSVNINEGDDLASLQSLDVSDADNERNGNEDVQDADLNKNILRRSRRLYVLSSKEDRTSATPKSGVIENQERRIASTSSAQGTRDGGDVQKHKQQIVKTCCTLGAKVKKLSQQLTLESIARCETELQTQASATSTTRQFLQFTEDEDQLIKHIWGCEQILIRPQQGRNTTIKWGPFQKRWLYLVAVLKLSKEGDNYNVRNREQLRQRMKYINPNPKQRKRRK